MAHTPEPVRRRRIRVTRDGILFVFGLAGIIYETVVEHGGNPTLLILFGAMVGLPAFLHLDERKTDDTKTLPPAVTPPKSAQDNGVK